VEADSELSDPARLGLHKAFEMVGAPLGKTFRYREEDRRIIEPGWRDAARLHTVKGPLLYVIAVYKGVVRYIGKWTSQTPLYSRWFRLGHISHASSHYGSHHRRNRWGPCPADGLVGVGCRDASHGGARERAKPHQSRTR
jgi:hypothetical protein